MKKRSVSEDAFFKTRVLVGFVLSCVGVCLALIGFGLYPVTSAPAAKPAASKAWQPKWTTVHSSRNDLSAPLREMATWALPPAPEGEREGPENPEIGIVQAIGSRPDTAVQNKLVTNLLASIIPGLNFDGVPFPGVVCNCAPPDTNGAVGSTQYVQIVNEGYQVFDKGDGHSLLGPASIRSLWAGFGGVCETNGSGDPVVLYDKIANRWVVTQFAVSTGTSVPNRECVAVSQTDDATGSYFRYDFDLRPFGSNFYDYPKLGSWTDAYYMSMNVFNSSGTAYLGTEPFAFDRSQMLAGAPATVISPGVVGSPANNEDPLIPSDFDGKILPPSGAPNTFLEFPDTTGNNGGHYRYWHYTVGTPFGTGASFTEFDGPTAASFTFLCTTTRACVPQLGSADKLDGIGDRLMYRLAYRNFGSPESPNESWVGNFSVSSGGVAAPRWFELKGLGGASGTINQEGTYQPDSTWRWMGSAAMDQDGNLALGFSASSASINPQIHYATRLATDPPGMLTSETDAFDGAGAQLDTVNRWGDYSAMTVDPVDDCTFWYTQEYYSNTSSFNWKTRIVNFKFDTCGGGGGGDITLEARARRRNDRNKVLLRWSPADGGDINVLRDGVIVQTTPDDGKAQDVLGNTSGTFTYQVCETDSGDCSNTVEVTVP
jgi:hypothetical protein